MKIKSNQIKVGSWLVYLTSKGYEIPIRVDADMIKYCDESNELFNKKYFPAIFGSKVFKKIKGVKTYNETTLYANYNSKIINYIFYDLKTGSISVRFKGSGDQRLGQFLFVHEFQNAIEGIGGNEIIINL